MTPDRRTLIGFIVVVAVPLVATALLIGNLQELPFAAKIIALMRGAAGEWWAVPLFVLLYLVFALFLLPVGLLSAAAALVWGWKVGGAIELVTCTFVALIPFQIARRGLSSKLSAFLARRGVGAPSFANEHELFPLFLLRLVPIVPYVALNYLAGLARFRMRDYVAATFFGSIPSIFLFAWFVDSLGARAAGTATQLRVVGACVVIALFAVLVRLVTQRVRRATLGDRTAPPPDADDRRSASSALPPE